MIATRELNIDSIRSQIVDERELSHMTPFTIASVSGDVIYSVNYLADELVVYMKKPISE